MLQLEYLQATTKQELKDILKLQQKNLSANISDDESKKEGFVTLKHTFSLLSEMNTAFGHIIAKHNGKVVGYALSMHPQFRNDVPELIPMFTVIDTLFHDKTRYMIMGQICIDKNYRKQGIFRGMYTYMKSVLKPSFDILFTLVDLKNQRSLNAHYALGFEDVYTYKSDRVSWVLIQMKIS